MADKVKLHRCNYTFIKHDIDACWKVQRALEEQGIPYEVVKQGWTRRESARAEVIELSGQKTLPVLEMPDGEVYRAESDEMAARIRRGELGEPTAS